MKVYESGVGIYKSKKESKKKERKHALDQEDDQEKKKDPFLVESVFSIFFS